MGKIIPIDLYDQDFLVHFGERKSLENALSAFVSEKKIKAALSGIDKDTVGHTMYNPEDGIYFIWLPAVPRSSKDMAVLMHEIFHFANMLLRTRGIPFSEDSEEAYAYLIQFLTKSIIDEFKISLS